MMKVSKILFLTLIAVCTACSSDDDTPLTVTNAEITGITATIDGEQSEVMMAARRAATQNTAIGRSVFTTDEKIVFTTIKRTTGALEPFTYSNIQYRYDGTSWERAANGTDNDPEKIYWTDGSSPHTFIGYSLPSSTYQWTPVQNAGGIVTYEGELGSGKTVIDYTLGNGALIAEDLLVNYSENTQAESDGLSTKVRFTHALSCVRVVVNIKDFAATASAEDTKVSVSDMMIYRQPTKFKWGADSKSLTVVNFSEQGEGHIKDLKLWCPKPAGEGDGQSKTFTFYGLTTPQDATFHHINDNNKPLDFSFTVTYPNPMNPTGDWLVKTYRGSFTGVNFESGKQTTLNISLNHRNEQMFMDVTYNDWNFVSTPDLGELRKKSTFLDINSTVTIHTDAKADQYDATWLYGTGSDIRDIYGNDGTEGSPYRISTAAQLLSFAKEVNAGWSFEGKYIRLDADITMQASTAKTSVEDETSLPAVVTWTGIGSGDNVFNGTFLGGDRYINRLYGRPLFTRLGSAARIEQLQVTTIGTISGGGALADSSAGTIAACKVIDDVKTTGGALVGTNSGVIYACCHTGDTYGKAGLVAVNDGSIVGCYQAGDVVDGTAYSISGDGSGTTSCPTASSLYDMQQAAFTATLNEELDAWYATHTAYPQYRFSHAPGSYPKVEKK